MNEDAIADIDALGVDATVVKGDIADRGRAAQFEVARRTLDRLAAPWHAFLGNHDYSALVPEEDGGEGESVDGYALLAQPRAPRTIDLGGWRLVLVDTVEPGHHHELIGRNPQVRAVLIGHTHRNRVRIHPAARATPFVEVHCVKDYPGGFAHYRLFEDGSLREEARRTSSARALAHSTRCREFFAGGYREFALGPLRSRSFVWPA